MFHSYTFRPEAPIAVMVLAAALVVAALAATQPCRAQAAADTVRIDLRGAVGTAGPVWLNGFAQRIAGDIIDYHSSHPDARSALLVRARRESAAAVWETEPVPADGGDTLRFLWLAGLERAGFADSRDAHTFHLSVNGERWFTFQNRKDAGDRAWSVDGPHGARLRWQADTADGVGDLHGRMMLTIPASACSPGRPLRLSVEGAKENSADWYMTFQYCFAFLPALRVEPLLARDGAGVAGVLRVSMDNLAPGRSVTVSFPGRPVVERALGVGPNIFTVPIPAPERPDTLPVRVSENGRELRRMLVPREPVHRREIHLLCYSHNDIGYTDLQPRIEEKQRCNLDAALALIDSTAALPPEARFAWNLEVLWILDGWWRRASEDSRARFLRAAREGRLGFGAFTTNFLTGLMTGDELLHATDAARWLQREHGIHARTAVISDIPGFTWGTVPALAAAGVRHFLIAPNSGDRVGHLYDSLADRPFYWESFSGEERLLTWVAGAGYSSFHEGPLPVLGDEKIVRLLRRLDGDAYPYETVPLPYTVGGDNGPPDPRLSAFVADWNRRFASPRLIITTTDRFFDAFAQRYGAALPRRRGDLTPYWEDGAFSTTRETVLARNAADKLVQAEALRVVSGRGLAGAIAGLHPAGAAGGGAPAGGMRGEAWRALMLYDEHTWGAHNSVSEPDLPSVRGQWEIKRGFADTASELSQSLLALKRDDRTAASVGRVRITNTTSWERSEVALVPARFSRGGDATFDAAGRAVPSQRLTTGELALRVDRLPPYCTREYRIAHGRATGATGAGAATVRAAGAGATGADATAGVLENGVLRFELDPAREGAAMVIDLRSGKALSTPAGLLRYLYVTDSAGTRGITHPVVTVKERGPMVASLLLTADAPGCRRYQVEYRLAAGADLLEMRVTLDKTAVRRKESVHFAFPFAVPAPVTRYDVPWGIVVPERDQIFGACKNYFSACSWVDVSNDSAGVTLALPDIPLFELDSVTAETGWRSATASSATVLSYAMNNYWHTNYKADQDGEVTLRYAIRPHGSFDAGEAFRFGRERREPLLAGLQGARDPLLTISSREILAGQMAIDEASRCWSLLLFNTSDAPQHAVLRWRDGGAVRMTLSRVDGGEEQACDGSVTLPPRALRLLRVCLAGE